MELVLSKVGVVTTRLKGPPRGPLPKKKDPRVWWQKKRRQRNITGVLQIPISKSPVFVSCYWHWSNLIGYASYSFSQHFVRLPLFIWAIRCEPINPRALKPGWSCSAFASIIWFVIWSPLASPYQVLLYHLHTWTSRSCLGKLDKTSF